VVFSLGMTGCGVITLIRVVVFLVVVGVSDEASQDGSVEVEAQFHEECFACE